MKRGYSYNKLYPQKKKTSIMASINRKKRVAPSKKAKKYIFLIVLVFGILLMNKRSSNATPEDKIMKEETSSNSSNSEENSGENENKEEDIVQDAIESLNKFEEKFEKDEKEREHLDATITELKEKIDETEEVIVEGKQEELAQMMESKRDQLTRDIRDYLETKDAKIDEKKVEKIVDRLKGRIDEEVKNDLRIQAETITMSKEGAVDEMALEDVIQGMENKDIEKDVVEYEKNILEDMKTEIDEAAAEIESMIDVTIDQFKTEVVQEVEKEEEEQTEIFKETEEENEKEAKLDETREDEEIGEQVGSHDAEEENV